jgi:glycosyltransferase involved in cell wall biosynthesis
LENRKEIQDSSNNPLVSLIVLTFNSSKYVLETLESAKNQEYKNVELIIADDFSTDETIPLCSQWIVENGHRFSRTKIIIPDKNTGIPQNCNRGLHNAEGKWIKIIAGDDVLAPDIISTYIKQAASIPNTAAVFSSMKWYNDTFEPQNILSVEKTENDNFNNPQSSPAEQFEILLRGNCVNAPTVMLKRDIVEKLGGFDNSFRLLEDWPMWLALTKAGYRMHYLGMSGVNYRVHSMSVQGLSNRKKYMSTVEMEVDELFLKKYNKYLPGLERVAKLSIIYRNRLIRKLFGNNNNKFISTISNAIGLLPSFILEQRKKTFKRIN